IHPRMMRHLLIVGLPFVTFGGVAYAQTANLPGIQIQLGDGTFTPVIKLIVLLTILSLAPAILMMMTSFTRVIVVLSFLRQALGTQQLPPNHLLIGLALFLTFFVMAPVWHEVNTGSLQPYMSKQIDEETALKNAERTMRDFMFAQTEEGDLKTFLGLARVDKPQARGDVPTWILVPSYMISELK